MIPVVNKYLGNKLAIEKIPLSAEVIAETNFCKALKCTRNELNVNTESSLCLFTLRNLCNPKLLFSIAWGGASKFFD